MTDNTKLSDIFTEIQAFYRGLEPLARALAASAEAIASSPQVRKLRSAIDSLAEQFPKVTLDPDVLGILERLPEWSQRLEANAALLDQAVTKLQDTQYSAVWHVFRARDLIDYAGLEPSGIRHRLYEHTCTDLFRDSLFAMYSEAALPSERAKILYEALALHRQRSFAGSVSLLYSQIEGILGDALERLNLAERHGTQDLRTVPSNPARLAGLHSKLELANRLSPADVYEALLQNCIVVGSIETRLANSRNGVLHGTDVDFANEDRSTQLVLWLAALLMQLHGVLGDQRTQS